MNKKYIIGIVAILLLALIYFITGKSKISQQAPLTTEVLQSDFLVTIYATGELKAKNSIKIRGPEGMRSAGVWQTNIKDLIPEGTVVKKGDYVASLDKTEIATKINEINSEIEKEKTRLEQIKIDTTLQMKQVRDEMANLEFSMAQEKLEIEKNKYEPQMVIEQSQLKLENSLRTLDQLKNKIELLVIQSNAKVAEVQANLNQLSQKLNQLTELSQAFTIRAPEDGMLIYESSWDGKKGPGSQISGWDPVVAQLPDLSEMTSVAYVNEVDISKVKKGQQVEVQVDAFPEKVFEGQIISVANIGQQLRGQEAKVFEIVIELKASDDVLKPAMTTTNAIKIYEYPDVVHIPLESYYSDSLDFVYLKQGGQVVKQEVISGATNENNIIVVRGLNQGDEVLLSIPENSGQLKWNYLSDDANSEATAILEKWASDKEAYDKNNAEQVKTTIQRPQEFGQVSRVIVF